MLEPKEIMIDEKSYLIHKFPAWDGVMLMGKIPQALDFSNPDEDGRKKVWAEVFSYIAIPVAKGLPIFLTTQGLIDNHVKGWSQMVKLMRAITEYNEDFLENGKL